MLNDCRSQFQFSRRLKPDLPDDREKGNICERGPWFRFLQNDNFKLRILQLDDTKKKLAWTPEDVGSGIPLAPDEGVMVLGNTVVAAALVVTATLVASASLVAFKLAAVRGMPTAEKAVL